MVEQVKITLKPNATSLARKEDYDKLKAHCDVEFIYVENNVVRYFLHYEGMWFGWSA